MNDYITLLHSSFTTRFSFKLALEPISVSALMTGFFLLFSIFIHAQEATTTVHIILADVLSIDSESAANGGSVDFIYENVADYNSQKIATVAKSLVITFSKPFDVKVKANGSFFESGSNTIPLDVLTIRRNTSSTVSGISTPIVLSTQDQVLVSGAALGAKLHLNLDYIIPQSKSSSNSILGKPSGTYTQTVTYSASAL
jgi:hypothetical protein